MESAATPHVTRRRLRRPLLPEMSAKGGEEQTCGAAVSGAQTRCARRPLLGGTLDLCQGLDPSGVITLCFPTVTFFQTQLELA
jgi:hypothetical protein